MNISKQYKQPRNSNMSYQFATAPISSNLYIAHIVNNIYLIMILNKEKKDEIEKYHKIIQGLETIVDIQLQLQNIVKLANAANNQLTDIKTTLLQASKNYKIDGDIYSISEEL